MIQSFTNGELQVAASHNNNDKKSVDGNVGSRIVNLEKTRQMLKIKRLQHLKRMQLSFDQKDKGGEGVRLTSLCKRTFRLRNKTAHPRKEKNHVAKAMTIQKCPKLPPRLDKLLLCKRRLGIVELQQTLVQNKQRYINLLKIGTKVNPTEK